MSVYRSIITMVFLNTAFFLFVLGVVPEVQCAVKRKEKKAQREKDKPNSTTDVSPEIIKVEPPELKVFKNRTEGNFSRTVILKACSSIFLD